MIYTLHWAASDGGYGRSKSTRNLGAVLKWSKKLEKEGYKEIAIEVEIDETR